MREQQLFACSMASTNSVNTPVVIPAQAGIQAGLWLQGRTSQRSPCLWVPAFEFVNKSPDPGVREVK